MERYCIKLANSQQFRRRWSRPGSSVDCWCWFCCAGAASASEWLRLRDTIAAGSRHQKRFGFFASSELSKGLLGLKPKGKEIKGRRRSWLSVLGVRRGDAFLQGKEWRKLAMSSEGGASRPPRQVMLASPDKGYCFIATGRGAATVEKSTR